MENELSRTDSLIKENVNKIKILMNKLMTDYMESYVDPVNLDEMRKIFKVQIYLLSIL